ncbi:MAG: TetR/AcrR family transcriptional regulator [Betaproteobacteria bacterium]|nr:TetR/AcrR family transcriptional regulator [Betaproteobacteria bacterium]
MRRRIIAAAAQLYREHGYERASMSDIAGRIGMTAPALYWYFQSKEDILAAFLEHTIANLIEFVGSSVRSRDFPQRLWEFMHAYVLWQLRQKDISAAYERIFALGHLRNSLPPRQREKIKSLERQFYRLCRGIVARGARAGRFRPPAVPPVAFALIGMVEHLIAWFRPAGRLSIRRIATLYADLAVRMVGAGAKRR